MRFFATAILATLLASCTEARICRSNKSTCDNEERYAYCRPIAARAYRNDLSRKVHPRGYILGSQEAPGEPVVLQMELKGYQPDRTYYFYLYSTADGTSTFNGDTCEMSRPVEQSTAPAMI